MPLLHDRMSASVRRRDDVREGRCSFCIRKEHASKDTIFDTYQLDNCQIIELYVGKYARVTEPLALIII